MSDTVINKETESVANASSDTSAPEDAWDMLRSLTGTLEGPEDWSEQLDHYLYGTPKR